MGPFAWKKEMWLKMILCSNASEGWGGCSELNLDVSHQQKWLETRWQNGWFRTVEWGKSLFTVLLVGLWFLVAPARCERRAWQSRLAHNSPTAPALQSLRLKRPLPHTLHPPNPHKHTQQPQNPSLHFPFFYLFPFETESTTTDICSFLPDDTKHVLVSLCAAIAASFSVHQNSPIGEKKQNKKQSQCVWCSVEEEAETERGDVMCHWW